MCIWQPLEERAIGDLVSLGISHTLLHVITPSKLLRERAFFVFYSAVHLFPLLNTMKAIVAIAFSLLFASPAASQSAPTPLDWDVIAHAFVAIDPLSYEEGIRIWEFPFPLADNASGKLPDYLQRSAVPVSELQAISRTISEAHEWSRSSTLSGKVSGGYASIGGSFEGSKSELRKRMSSTFWEGTQVVGNYHIATLTLDPFGAPLSPSVRREFIMIAHTLAKGSVVARTAAKSLMDDFLDVAGVEVVISVDYGVSLEQNHLLDISEWSDYTKESSEMCASAHFASYASAKVSYQVSEEELNKYRNAIRVESVISSGGHPFLSNDTMDSWLTGAVQRPVPIRRKTIPLSEIITPLLFRPEDNLTLSEIQELRKLVVNCTAGGRGACCFLAVCLTCAQITGRKTPATAAPREETHTMTRAPTPPTIAAAQSAPTTPWAVSTRPPLAPSTSQRTCSPWTPLAPPASTPP